MVVAVVSLITVPSGSVLVVVLVLVLVELVVTGAGGGGVPLWSSRKNSRARRRPRL